MKKNSKNKKGMTLVEVIIAMALLSGMSAMLVTVAVAAKRILKTTTATMKCILRQ
mgnify:CR=1 FL=1